MTGMWNLTSLHAALAASSPESTCSLLRRAYPIDRTAKPTKPTRAAGSQFARGHMLAQSLPAARAFFAHYPLLI